MPLRAGYYNIYSGPVYVGRNLYEDLSLHPKRILALPRGVRPLSSWIVEPLNNGRYRLRAGGAPVAAIDGLLWAILIGQEERDLEWVITPQPNGLYIIKKSSGDEVWVNVDSSDGDMSQIAVKADHSSKRLFRFEPVLDD